MSTAEQQAIDEQTISVLNDASSRPVLPARGTSSGRSSPSPLVT